MQTQTLSTLDTILDSYREQLGTNYEGYRNHCYRACHFCFELINNEGKSLTAEDSEKLQIAFAFHDLGLFTDNTVDYLPPSEKLARAYLAEEDKADWAEEIALMISEHHKITPYKNAQYPLVEVVRQADLVDFSLGMIRLGVAKSAVKQLKKQFPNAGFHKMVATRQVGRIKSHPSNPFPIFKW